MKPYKNRKKNWIRYDLYMLSDKWEKKRQMAISKQKKCYCCDTKKSLTVHHRSYHNLGRERMDELVVLCWRCHKKVHKIIRSDSTVKLNNAHKIYRKMRKRGNN